MRRAVRSFAALLLLPLLTVLAAQSAPGETLVWRAGAYSFSDELGGFAILGATGSGTKEDPIVLVQELYSASPVTVVIRAVAPIRPYTFGGLFANGFLHMQIVARNASALAWTEFEFELQEHLGQPSVFSDGLSFDQRRTQSSNISSSAFGRFQRDFEPYDRLLFTDGFIDPGEEADFSFLISDFTPKLTFFLVLDPRIPSS